MEKMLKNVFFFCRLYFEATAAVLRFIGKGRFFQNWFQYPVHSLCFVDFQNPKTVQSENFRDE
jgi:hypothetical protein